MTYWNETCLNVGRMWSPAISASKWGILKGGPQLADCVETAVHIHKDATDWYAPCLRALLLFARPIVNIGDLLLCCTNNSKCNTEWYYLYL